MKTITQAWAAVKSWFSTPYGGTTAYVGGTKRYAPSEKDAIDANTIVLNCLETICDSFVDASIATFTVSEDGEEKFDHTSPFSLLMRNPDPLRKINGRRQMRAAVSSYILDGNLYLDLTADATGIVREVSWVPHWSCKPIEDKDGLLLEYEITLKDGTVEKRKPHEIVHIAKGIDPKNRLKGLSPLKKYFLQVLTDNECDAYTAEVIANPSIVGWAVMPKEGTNPEDAALVEQKINTKFSRGGRGGTLVPHFPSTIEKLGFSPADLAIDKMRRTPEARISGIMNVPAILAGLEVGLDHSTFANTEEARKYFTKFTMVALWDVFGEEFTIQLLPYCEGFKKGQRAGYDLRKVAALQEEQEALHKRAREDFTANLLKRNEARSMIGLKSGPGDDVYIAEITGSGPVGSPEQLKARLASSRRVHEALGLGEADETEL